MVGGNVVCKVRRGSIRHGVGNGGHSLWNYGRAEGKTGTRSPRGEKLEGMRDNQGACD